MWTHIQEGLPDFAALPAGGPVCAQPAQREHPVPGAWPISCTKQTPVFILARYMKLSLIRLTMYQAQVIASTFDVQSSLRQVTEYLAWRNGSSPYRLHV